MNTPSQQAHRHPAADGKDGRRAPEGGIPPLEGWSAGQLPTTATRPPAALYTAVRMYHWKMPELPPGMHTLRSLSITSVRHVGRGVRVARNRRVPDRSHEAARCPGCLGGRLDERPRARHHRRITQRRPRGHGRRDGRGGEDGRRTAGLRTGRTVRRIHGPTRPRRRGRHRDHRPRLPHPPFRRDGLRQQRLPPPLAGPRGGQPGDGADTARRDSGAAGPGMSPTVADRPGTPERAAPSPMLQRLAAERATGALMRDRGTLYLADGQVVHAESPATPGIDVLLTTGGALRSEGWWDAVAQAGAGQRVARYLVDSGR